MTNEEKSPSGQLDLLALSTVLASHWRKLLIVPILAGAAAVGLSFLVKPTFTARTTFLPPQQQQNSASSALAAIGSLTSLTGGPGLKTPGDQFVAFLQSNTIADRIIEAFDLKNVYQTDLHSLTRKGLADRSRMTSGKKDGVVVIEVDDTDPKRAADIANRYVDELRRLTGSLAITEAQHRRIFFEKQLQATRQNLANAQAALQGTLFDSSALKAEPKAAADAYAKLKAEVTTLEVRLQSLRTYFNEDAMEVRSASTALAALRSQLSKLESAGSAGSADSAAGRPDYVAKYRDFKYQETLFEMFFRQFELAKVDESRDGLLIQAIDKADPPDHKSKPKRAQVGVLATLLTFAAMAGWLLGSHALRVSKVNNPEFAESLRTFGSAFRRRR